MKIKDNWYTLCVIILVILAYNFPEQFITVNGVKMSGFIKPILQLIMFGMGATMTLDDFIEVFKSPKKVIIGLVAQFTIMPVLGFGLSRAFYFPPEIAAGIILIGCSPSGLASNVMALLAKANVALSITITTMATLIAPIMTPFLMKTLGGELLEINFLSMFWDMTQLVLLPIFIGLLINKLIPNIVKKLIAFLPILSMAGIAFIILIVTANGASSLKTVGFILVLVVVIHNVLGYILGYFSAKMLRLNEADARAIALEVGMQNGGLASALANEMGKIATVGLAPAIFGPLMNITGSTLANYWSKTFNGNKDLRDKNKGEF